MYISLIWVQELIGIQELTLDELVDRLTLTGFEIESISTKKQSGIKDFILDISFTANRSDVSNIKGLINELGTLFPSKLFLQAPQKIKPLILAQLSNKQKNLRREFPSKKFSFEFLVKNNSYNFLTLYQNWQFEYCLWEWYLQKKSFSGLLEKINSDTESSSNPYLTLFNIKSKKFQIKESSKWIKKRLILMGISPQNNILDTINYIMLETGQVFFAYDFHNLKNLTETSNVSFIPKYAKDKDQFPICDSKSILLNSKILTLTINGRIICVPGLLQHFKTIVSNNTSQILLQCSLFDSTEVKKASKILNLRTESSKKLEKTTDLNLLEQAYIRLKHLFWTQNIKFEDEEHEKNTFHVLKNNSSLFSKYIKQSQKRIKVIYQNIKEITGPSSNIHELRRFQIIKNLKSLNFKIYLPTEQQCYVGIPLARQMDLEREIDIIEEIVRIIGFNKFQALPITTDQVGYLTKIEKLKRELRNYFLTIGFNESLHATLVKMSSDNEIKLKNPIYTESSTLRTSLLDGILEKAQLNHKNIGISFEAFELGRIYNLLENGKKQEIEVISGVFGGNIFRSTWNTDTSSLSWFEAKGFLETLFEKLNLQSAVSWRRIANPISKFHPNLTSNLFIGNNELGIFGQIHPTFALKKGLKTKLFLFELNVEILNSFCKKKNLINYIPYSYYPISYVDLSFLVKNSITAEEIKQIIYMLGQPLLKTVVLVDYYYNEPIRKGYCSLTFKLKFQSEIRTLSNDEIVEIITPLIRYLETNYDIKIQQ